MFNCEDILVNDSYFQDLPFCTDEKTDIWLACISQLNEYTSRVGEFAWKIPEFDTLNSEDQNLLVHSSTHSVILLCLCFQSSRMRSLNNQFQWNYFNTQPNSSLAQHFQQTFPFLFDLNQFTYSIEKELLILELDDKEIALILTILVVSIGLFMNFS